MVIILTETFFFLLPPNPRKKPYPPNPHYQKIPEKPSRNQETHHGKQKNDGHDKAWQSQAGGVREAAWEHGSRDRKAEGGETGSGGGETGFGGALRKSEDGVLGYMSVLEFQ